MTKHSALVRLSKVEVRLSPDERRLLVYAAAAESMPLSTWVRWVTVARAKAMFPPIVMGADGMAR